MPGVIVEDRDTARPRAVPTDTSVAFLSAEAQKGVDDAAIEITSMSRATLKLGAELANSYLIPALEQFFRRGGSKAYVTRPVGPAAAKAALALTATGTTLTVTAESKGTWGNGAAAGLSVQVIQGPVGGATFRLLIILLGGVEVERTPEFQDTVASRQAVVDWSASSDYVRITLGGGSGIPAVAAAANLAGGVTDDVSITPTIRETALSLLHAGLGPGQVAMPGITVAQSHLDLIEHGKAFNRAPLLDGPNTTVKATLLAATTALRAVDGAESAAMFAPFVQIPGSAVGVTRTLPPSALLIGMIATTDRVAGVSQATAGDFGLIPDAKGLTASFSDSDAEELNNASVNLIRSIDGDIQVYGWRSLVDKTAEPNWWPWTTGRLAMFIRANAKAAGRRLVFRRIDGFGHLLAEFEGKLDGFMKRLWLAGELYSDPEDQRPETAYRINTGSALNTPGDLASGFLEAEIQFRPPGMAEWVTIGVVNVPITTPIS